MDPNSKVAAHEPTKDLLATAASIAASAMLARSLVNDFLPKEARGYFSLATKALRARFSAGQHIVNIEEVEGWSRNLVYSAVQSYLAAKISSSSTRRVRVSKRAGVAKKSIDVFLEEGEEVTDTFQGGEFKWRLLSRDNNVVDRPKKIQLYQLSFHRTYKDVAFDAYLPYVLDRANEIKAGEKKLKIHLNEEDWWTPVSLHHPATFDTLAMDTDLKQEVMGDLARFVERKEYYRKIGRAWKRGYLIYGPPGTGKSSLVAAMANYLKFDIYDLELTAVKWNSALKRLLIGMKNKSILLVEDVDCSIQLQRREPPGSEAPCSRGKDERVTLSGLLNFVDGLWSSCGEEKIIVFTTNYKDRLDPALLRPGRMDVHVHMGYCGASAFRTLAYNYHDVDGDHPLFGEIEEMIGEAKVTPGEVAEELTRSDDVESALRGLVEFLQVKRDRGSEEEGEEMEDKRDEEFDLLSNVSNPEKDYNEDGPHWGSSRTMYSRDRSPISFRGGRGGYVLSFRGRGGHLQSFRGSGEGNLQSYRGRGRGRGRRGRRQFVNVVRGKVVSYTCVLQG